MDQIAEINSQVKATVGVSKIHGVGVIAITSIPKGNRIYANELPRMYKVPYGSINKLFPEIKKIILDRWPSLVNGGRIIIHDVRLLSLMNHSPDPNYAPETDTALRDINAGEEITENYREMRGWERVFPDLPNWEKQNKMELCPLEFIKENLAQMSIDTISRWLVWVKSLVRKHEKR